MELPNYYDALVKTRLAETAGVLTDELKVELEAELRRVLRNKIQVAIENAVGYGLDSVETEAPAAAMPTGDGWDQGQEDDMSSMSDGLAEIPMLGDTSGEGGGADPNESAASLAIPELDGSFKGDERKDQEEEEDDSYGSDSYGSDEDFD